MVPCREAWAVIIAEHANKAEYATESGRETSMRHANSLLLVGSFAAAAKTSDTHREEGMKDQKKIRLGLIGVGNWALFAHVRVLRLLPEYEIVPTHSPPNKPAKPAATAY